MNLDDLKVIRNDERRSRRLTPLKDTFYVDLKGYLSSLKDSKDQQKTDEYENALHVAEAIYDKRVAKITKLAALAAKGHKEGAPLTEEETKVFNIVFDVFTRYKEDMLAFESSDNVQGAPPPDYEQNDHLEVGTQSKDASPKEDEAEVEAHQGEVDTNKNVSYNESSTAGQDTQLLDNARALIQENKNMKYVQVRVLADIPAFIGLDGENYKLSKGETALLPEGNARALIKRQVAIIIGDRVEDA